MGWCLIIRATRLSRMHLYLKLVILRNFLQGMRNRMTKAKRKAFAEESATIVKRKRRPDGSVSVCCPQLNLGSWSPLHFKGYAAYLRTGTPLLRATQEYPAAFGKAIACLHLEDLSKNLQARWKPLDCTWYELSMIKK